MWPFGSKKLKQEPKETEATAPGSEAQERQEAPAAPERPIADAAGAAAPLLPHDDAELGDQGQAQAQETATTQDTEQEGAVPQGAPLTPETGPFDGDTVDIDAFDFSDFAVGILNLGSLKVPMPVQSQVQVEMGETGPRMLHIVTEHGRITPVAFAAPRSGGWWRTTVPRIVDKMREDNLNPQIVDGPWGREIVSENPGGQVRVIGIDGPRWMLRLTVAAPTGHEEDLASQARELAARTFVYRGEAPILAGNSLPVAIPAQLAVQLQQAMAERRAAQGQAGAPGPGQDGAGQAE